MGQETVKQADLQALSKALAEDLNRSAAAMLRMQAHTLSSQAALLEEMSEKLREEATRVEHGGELPDLRVVEESEETKALMLPAIARWDDGGYRLAEGGRLPGWVRDFLEQINDRWLAHPAFPSVFNAQAAGEAPVLETAQMVVDRIRDLDPQ